jgi:hypothetical protein
MGIILKLIWSIVVQSSVETTIESLTIASIEPVEPVNSSWGSMLLDQFNSPSHKDRF